MKTITRPVLALMSLPLMAGLTACEARLNLAGVDKTRAEPIRRTDHWHAVAANNQTLVVTGNAGVLLVAPRGLKPQWQRLQLDTTASLIDATSCGNGQLAVLAADRQLWTATADGQQWTAHPIPASESLLTLECAPDGSLWIGGSFSTLMKSVDGGNDWESQSLDEDAQISAVRFVDASQGFALGEFGMVAMTTDGGDSWNSVGPLPDEFYPQGVWFESAERGWVSGLTGTILRTDDGGQNWSAEASGTAAPLYHLGEVQVNGQPWRYALGDHSTLLLQNPADGQWQARTVSPSPAYLSDAIAVDDQLLVVGGGGSLLFVDLAAPAAVRLSSAASGAH